MQPTTRVNWFSQSATQRVNTWCDSTINVPFCYFCGRRKLGRKNVKVWERGMFGYSNTLVCIRRCPAKIRDTALSEQLIIHPSFTQSSIQLEQQWLPTWNSERSELVWWTMTHKSKVKFFFFYFFLLLLPLTIQLCCSRGKHIMGKISFPPSARLSQCVTFSLVCSSPPSPVPFQTCVASL